MAQSSSVLQRIVAEKQREVAALIDARDANEMKNRALSEPPCRDFLNTLRRRDRVPIIAEIKKSSPSLGAIAPDVDVASQARTYRDHGAAALSVLTDGPFFGGSLDDLVAVREAVDLPVLRKDFIIDPIQLYQSRTAGADAVLLIVAALTPETLHALYQETLELGMTPLVEVHNEPELDAALTLNPALLGINNRDLATLTINLETCLRLRPLAPSHTLVVGESGIKGPEDVALLRSGGIDAFLVGTTLMAAPDPGATLADLCRAGA